MSIDFSYYDDKYPLNFDAEQLIQGVKYTIGKHSYGIELIRLNNYDPTAAFHIGRFCAIANTEFYLGGSKNVNLISTAFFIPKFFSKSTYGSNDHDKINGEPVDNSIYIGNDVWIGNRSTIMPKVVVGNGAVIAANSHVVTNVPPYAIYGGNPAKLISFRFNPDIISKLNLLAWWELEDSVINEIIPYLTTSQNSIEMTIDDLIASFENLPRTNAFVDKKIKSTIWR
jgi:acetyltransferase-like isoleucine patch superfamily enzyme